LSRKIAQVSREKGHRAVELHADLCERTEAEIIMAKYLLVESRDPFETKGTLEYYELAAQLAKESELTLFLLQNGVFPARRCRESQRLMDLAKAGVRVLAEEFSLRERGIRNDQLCEGIESAGLDVVIDQLAEGRKALWH
jgi:sulfur relay (sulfurtransferase) complex TusBCD TusD component (DsrE family)